MTAVINNTVVTGKLEEIEALLDMKKTDGDKNTGQKMINTYRGVPIGFSNGSVALSDKRKQLLESINYCLPRWEEDAKETDKKEFPIKEAIEFLKSVKDALEDQ